MNDGRENLIPFNKMPKCQHLQMSKNGGRSKSVAKSEGATFRYIKERLKRSALTDKDKEWLLKTIEERPSFGVHMLIKIQELEKSIHPSQRVALLNTELAAGKFIHGEKLITENKNVNIDLNYKLTDEDKDELLTFLNRGKKDDTTI